MKRQLNDFEFYVALESKVTDLELQIKSKNDYILALETRIKDLEEDVVVLEKEKQILEDIVVTDLSF